MKVRVITEDNVIISNKMMMMIYRWFSNGGFSYSYNTSSVAILGVYRGGGGDDDDDDDEDGDMGEVTSILITAEMELSIVSTIVSSVDSILENRKITVDVKGWDGGEHIEQKFQHWW